MQWCFFFFFFFFGGGGVWFGLFGIGRQRYPQGKKKYINILRNPNITFYTLSPLPIPSPPCPAQNDYGSDGSPPNDCPSGFADAFAKAVFKIGLQNSSPKVK